MEKKTRGRPRKVVEQPDIEEELAIAQEPQFVEVFIVKSCKNTKWKLAIDRKGDRCFVAVPKTLVGLLDGKLAKVERIDGSEENHYNFVA